MDFSRTDESTATEHVFFEPVVLFDELLYSALLVQDFLDFSSSCLLFLLVEVVLKPLDSVLEEVSVLEQTLRLFRLLRQRLAELRDLFFVHLEDVDVLLVLGFDAGVYEELT